MKTIKYRTLTLLLTASVLLSPGKMRAQISPPTLIVGGVALGVLTIIVYKLAPHFLTPAAGATNVAVSGSIISKLNGTYNYQKRSGQVYYVNKANNCALCWVHTSTFYLQYPNPPLVYTNWVFLDSPFGGPYWYALSQNVGPLVSPVTEILDSRTGDYSSTGLFYNWPGPGLTNLCPPLDGVTRSPDVPVNGIDAGIDVKWAITNMYTQNVMLGSASGPPTGMAFLVTNVSLSDPNTETVSLNISTTNGIPLFCQPQIIPPDYGVDYNTMVDFYQTYGGITVSTNAGAAGVSAGATFSMSMSNGCVVLVCTNCPNPINVAVERSGGIQPPQWQRIYQLTVPQGMPIQLYDYFALNTTAFYWVHAL